jgi:hypothetical protein
MAFTAKDGSKHTNRDSMKHADARHSAMPGKSPAALESPDGEEPQDGEAEGPHEVVDAHGPATEVHVAHDHAAGRHHVVSNHQDGHQHETEHASAGEAHDMGKCLSGDCDCGGM